jgi:hypothetical protein
MSRKASSMVWETACREPSDKFVLLALADHANDDGVCYPSMHRLAERTGFALRTVRTAVRRLCEDGLLSVERNAGPRGCNLFTVFPEGGQPRQQLPPGSRCTPATNDPLPRQPTVMTPATVAPEPLRTINEPSRARATGRRTSGATGRAEKQVGGNRDRFLLFWSGVIKDGGFVPPTALKPADVEQLLEHGLVTAEQLQALGLRRAVA